MHILAVCSASEQQLIRLGLSERGDMICVKSFCTPANLEEPKTALVDKSPGVGTERIAERSFCSKSVSAGWVHYDSVKKKCICVTKAKRAAMQQCIFLNQAWEKRYCPRLKRYFFVIKGHCTGQRMI